MTDRDAGTQAAAASSTLLWEEHPAVKRGPKPKLRIEQIADAAIAIADAEGLEAVTMQRVGTHVGATKMALYRYVPGRRELEAAMLDRGMGVPRVHRGTWQTSLTAWAMDLFERAREHPWAVEVAQRAHTPGPQEMLWFEAGLSVMKELPLSAGERLDVLAILSDHALSLARRAASGSTEGGLAESISAVLASRSESYPLTAEAFSQVSEAERDPSLAFGTDRLIDGVESLVARRSATC